MTLRTPLQILASLRSAKLEVLDQELEKLKLAGVNGLHLDIMDGNWVEETCFPAVFCKELRSQTELLLDLHLMIEDPDLGAAAYLDCSPQRVAFHLEAAKDPGNVISQIRARGVLAGIVVLPSTPIAELRPWIALVDFINPLGVDPTQGLGFQESTFARIAELVALREETGLDFAIQADGGVWEKTRDGLVDAGADELVAGYPIFSSGDYSRAVNELRG